MENSHKIEAYFNNELSSADEQKLMKELETNNELKQDFEFQKDVVEGLKAYRKEQLIARLNEVKMISTTQHLVVKVISSIAVVAVVGLGAYFFYYTNNNESKLISEATKTVVDESIINEQQPQIADVATQQEIDEVQTDLTEDADIEMQQAQQPAVKEEKIISEKTPEVIMPDVVDSFDSELVDTSIEEDLSVPANTIATGLNLRSKLDVEIKMKRRYNFHYQLIEQKLVLYGDFEDEPFEILEINKDDGGIDLYLYHKDNFYGIEQGSDKIEPLKEIVDPVLIQRLQALR